MCWSHVFFLWPMFKFNIVNPSHDLTTTYENLCTERSSRTKGRKKQLQVIYRNNHKLEIVWSHSFFWAQNNNCTLELGQLNVTLCPRVSLLMRIFLSLKHSHSRTCTHIHTDSHSSHMQFHFWYVNFLTLPDIRKATCNFFYSQSFDKRIVGEREKENSKRNIEKVVCG